MTICTARGVSLNTVPLGQLSVRIIDGLSGYVLAVLSSVP